MISVLERLLIGMGTSGVLAYPSLGEDLLISRDDSRYLTDFLCVWFCQAFSNALQTGQLNLAQFGLDAQVGKFSLAGCVLTYVNARGAVRFPRSQSQFFNFRVMLSLWFEYEDASMTRTQRMRHFFIGDGPPSTEFNPMNAAGRCWFCRYGCTIFQILFHSC